MLAAVETQTFLDHNPELRQHAKTIIENIELKDVVTGLTLLAAGALIVMTRKSGTNASVILPPPATRTIPHMPVSVANNSLQHITIRAGQSEGVLSYRMMEIDGVMNVKVASANAFNPMTGSFVKFKDKAPKYHSSVGLFHSGLGFLKQEVKALGYSEFHLRAHIINKELAKICTRRFQVVEVVNKELYTFLIRTSPVAMIATQQHALANDKILQELKNSSLLQSAVQPSRWDQQIVASYCAKMQLLSTAPKKNNISNNRTPAQQVCDAFNRQNLAPFSTSQQAPTTLEARLMEKPVIQNTIHIAETQEIRYAFPAHGNCYRAPNGKHFGVDPQSNEIKELGGTPPPGIPDAKDFIFPYNAHFRSPGGHVDWLRDRPSVYRVRQQSGIGIIQPTPQQIAAIPTHGEVNGKRWVDLTCGTVHFNNGRMWNVGFCESCLNRGARQYDYNCGVQACGQNKVRVWL